jgi:replication-associated recombination protein RarA
MKAKLWYNELGFSENPFTIKPAKFSKEIFGHKFTIEDIISRIKESKAILITGEYGTGKTSIVKKIISEFRGKLRIAYYNCNRSYKTIDFDRILRVAGGFFHWLFRIRKKGILLILDEAQDLNKKDMDKVAEYYEKGFFKSVVLATKGNDIQLTDSLKKLVEGNMFNITGINASDAVRIARNRIGSTKFISDKLIVEIFLRNKNPRKFLKNCEEVFRAAFDQGSRSVQKRHVEEVLGQQAKR